MNQIFSLREKHKKKRKAILEQLWELDDSDGSDFEAQARIGLLLADAYRQDGDVEQALKVCKKTLKREKSQYDIDLNILYAECLIEPDVKSKNNLLEAYKIFELMDQIAYEVRQKLAVQFGLASCWAHNIPAKPKAKDIILIGNKILGAFDRAWKIQSGTEEKEQVLRLWSPQLNFFIDQFTPLIPSVCWEICEMMRSRFLLIDLGHSMNYFSSVLSIDLVKEEAELANQLRELDKKINQLHNSPPPPHFFSRILRLDGPESIASLDKQRKNVSRRRDYILNQLRRISDRDEESIDMRTGASVSYSELRELLKTS